MSFHHCPEGKCVLKFCGTHSIPHTVKVFWMHRSQQYMVFYHHLPLVQYHSIQLNSAILIWFWIIKSLPYTAQGALSEKWSIACHISKQRISQPSAVSHHRWWVAEPWGNSEGKSICYPATIRCSHSLWWALRNSGCENTGYWLQIAEIQYQRNDFNEPRLLHLPIHERALNSLTWNV